MAHSGVVELEESSPASSMSLEGAEAFTEKSTSPQPAIMHTVGPLKAFSAEVWMGIFMQLLSYLVVK